MSTMWSLIGSGWALWFGGLICSTGGQPVLGCWLYGLALAAFIAAPIFGWRATR